MNGKTHAVNAVTRWDTMRKRLKTSPHACESLESISARVGLEWVYSGGGRAYSDVLALRWRDLSGVLGYGKTKRHHILQLTERVFRQEFGVSVAREDVASESANHRLGEDRERDWDEARHRLAGRAMAEMSLCKCASELGTRWPYLRGDEPLNTFLALDWKALRALRGFGRRKTDTLLGIVLALTEANTLKVRAPAPVQQTARAGINVAEGLAALGIPFEMPCELLCVSGRVRNLLRHDGRRTLGALLEYLAATDAEHLMCRNGVGRGTVSELYGLLTAVTSTRTDLARGLLPLRATGSGLCFSAFAKHLMNQQEPHQRAALFAYFAERDTLRIAGQRVGRTAGRVGQLVSAFMRRIDRGLVYFPEEKHNLWKAWQRCEGLDLLLEDDLDTGEKLVVAGALDRVFSGSPEGKAILAHREDIFDSWWDDVRDRDEFYFGGLRAARFVRDRGEPQLLQSFLDYLEGKPGVEVSRTTGKACSSRQSLRRVVHAIVCSSTHPLEAVEILERLRAEGLFGDLRLDTFYRKVGHWVNCGKIPADKIVLTTERISNDCRHGVPQTVGQQLLFLLNDN